MTRPPREASPRGRALKLLLVDDHVLMLRSISRLLPGFETIVASSARQALQILQSGAKVDAIVCDVMMPAMSGPELYVHCYRQSPDLGRRFIFASADPVAARPLIERHAQLVGAMRPPLLLEKPMSHAALLAAVYEVATPHESGTYELGLACNLSDFDQGEPYELSESTRSKGSRGGR